MSNFQKNANAVRFPKFEKAVALCPTDKIPFSLAMIGTTFPDASYEIHRVKTSNLTVFEFVLEGEGEILLCGEWKRARAGDLYILRGGDEHFYRSNKKNPWKKVWINYVADYILSFMDACGVQSGIYRCEAARKYFELAKETARYEIADRESCLSVAEYIHKIISLVAAKGRAEPSMASKIHEELTAAVYKKLDLDELAVRLHISKSSLIRIYKKRYGVTPYEHLLSLKIETARLLLINTEMPVCEIADRLAISDEHYFSVLFRKRTGAAPSEYRLQNNNKNKKNLI